MCARRLAVRSLLIAAAVICASPIFPQARADGGDVEITAALINAGQGRSDASHEWVLLTNIGTDAVDLSGWTLADNSSSDSLGEQTLAGGASLLIAAACAALIGAPAADQDAILADAAIGRGLGNRGDQLELHNSAGGLIDAVSWGDVDTYGERSTPNAGEPLRFGDAPIPPARTGANPIRLSIRIADKASEDGAPAVELVNECEWEQPLDGWSVAQGENRVDLSGLIAPPNGAVEVALNAATAVGAIELRSPDGQVINAVAWSPGAVPMPEVEEVAEQQEAPPAASVSIRITEFMPRPAAGEPEWVELINDGDETIDLSGWRLGDARSSRELWGDLAPRARVVFAADQIAAPNGEVRLLGGAIGNGLNNDGDTLQLIAPDGSVVEAIEYGSPQRPTPAAGASLALTPQVWVVNQTPSPGGAEVSPALQAPNVVAGPVERSPAPPAQIAELQADGGINPWMVVSAGLAGLLIALQLRRWFPNQRDAESDPHPPDAPPPEAYDYEVGGQLEGQAVGEDPPPYDAPQPEERRRPWDGDDE